MGKKPAAPCSYIQGLSRRKLSELEKLVIQLRKEKCTSMDIAEILELPHGIVDEIVASLLANRRTTDHRRKKDLDLRNLEDERTKTIISMVQQRATLAAIGKELEVTKEGARKIIERITQIHGKEVFGVEDPVLMAHEVAKKLGVSLHILRRICASGEIDCQKYRVGGQKKSWLLRKSDIEEIKKHRLITGKRTCVICKKTFVRKAGLRRVQACSRKCEKAHHAQARKIRIAEDPGPDSLAGWTKELWQRLQSHRILKGEEWIIISEAFRRTGLSKMQLNWLRVRRIVTTKPHPHKKWRGRPVAMYAVSEIEIAEQVYKKHCRLNGKK